ncbi:GNAT family N-acetyltransferase [Sporolactobacillus pectinivorans]|uniref:GNAT family N-acetyltransferase n=1 Tax=Sporolactobacillus pectinivorans TaxID=1591408 RepID=UPI000C25D84C|nr:GNAT family N-acetyltransferase [Sporolactobacillus pectinivorans]
MIIREAVEKDCKDIASLINQLGYPTTVKQMHERFCKLNSAYQTFVADYEGHVIGLIGLCKGLFYEIDGSYIKIVALVIDSKYRHEGIGKKLLIAAEEWALAQGIKSVGVNSGNRPERCAAHQFYRNMGFIDKSIGFIKHLDG